MDVSASWARRHGWWCYLLLASAAGALYFVFPTAQAKLIFWPLIGWTSVGAIVLGTRWHNPTDRRPWRFIAAGTALFIIGDNLYTHRAQIQHSTAMFPSYVDVVYLAMYPTMIVGLALLVRRRTQRERAAVIDAAIITAAIGLLAWVLLIAPYLTGEMPVLARLTSIAYPLADVALLAVGVRLAVGSGIRSQSFWLLVGAIVPLIAADSLYGYLNIIGRWHEHNPVDAGWIAFYLGWGAAALHPSMVHLTEPTKRRSVTGAGRLIVVAGAAMIPPIVLLVEQADHHVDDAIAIGVIGIVLYALVFVRIAGLARVMAENEGESRFRSLVQNASDATIVLDTDGRVVYETPSTERVLGASLMDVDRRPFGDFLHPADRQKLRILLADPDQFGTAEWRLRDGDAWRYIDVVAADLRNEPSVAGVALTIRDSTERKRLAAEREAAVERANEASRQKSAFLANMSHEIRTPLNGLMGMLGLVRSTSLDDEQRDYFDTMADSAESLAALVNDVLDFSRIEAGRLELDRQAFPLRAAVEAGLSNSLSAARLKGIGLRAEFDGALPDVVVGDRLRLRQVLSNLASNAVKFTDEGEVVVRVRPAGRVIQFDVIDTGIGIAESGREKLFEQYVQADTTTTRRHGGSGLGLAICKQLTTLMGGEIGVESAVNKGSRFWFTVAFEEPEAVAVSSGRVLVVSALGHVRVALTTVLSDHGYDVVSSTEARQALAALEDGLAKDEAFDVVIVGDSPVGLDQLELARLIRFGSGYGSPRIVGLTTRSDSAFPHDPAVDAWVAKPVDTDALMRALTETMTAAVVSPAVPAASSPAAARDHDRRGRLLVVEDNCVNQKVAVALLTKLGFDVDVANDGVEALDALDARDYDAVLMDCQMPRMDGYETTIEFRRREVDRHTPIIAMTASAMSSDRDRCLEVGMDDYLTKPIDMQELDRVLTSFVANHAVVRSDSVTAGATR